MSFMSLYSQHGTWYVVDGPCGGDVIPADLAHARFPETDVLQLGDPGFADLESALLPYYEGNRLDSIELASGWCARYSANGYMDCTSWCGPYATEDEALRECRDLYGDDGEDEYATDDDGMENAP